MPKLQTESARITVVGGDMPFEVLSGTYVQQRFAPHTHETYAIGTIERGASRVQYRGETVLHTVGEVIAIDPGEPHTGETASPDGWTYRMLYVPVALISSLGVMDSPPQFARSAYRDPDLARRLVTAHRLLESDASTGEKLAALGRVLRELCQRHATPSRDERRVRRTLALDRVRRHVEAHYASRIAVADLADLAHMSVFHLIRQFRLAYGLPPYMYLEQVRVTRAKELLRRGDHITSVAYVTGFSDQSHLTRRFKRIVGVPPGQYAKCYAAAPARITAQRVA